jgi:mRNA interferase MazF
VRIDPPAGGLKVPSYVKCEDLRSVSKERLSRRWGHVTAATLRQVEAVVRVLLEL